MWTGMSRSRQTIATSSESVATTTVSIWPEVAAARQTHSTMGRPAIIRRTFRGIRVERSRAGMTPATRNVLMQASLQEQAGGFIRSGELGAAAFQRSLVSE